jgi:hypothetical protein
MELLTLHERNYIEERKTPWPVRVSDCTILCSATAVRKTRRMRNFERDAVIVAPDEEYDAQYDAFKFEYVREFELT